MTKLTAMLVVLLGLDFSFSVKSGLSNTHLGTAPISISSTGDCFPKPPVGLTGIGTQKGDLRPTMHHPSSNERMRVSFSPLQRTNSSGRWGVKMVRTSRRSGFLVMGDEGRVSMIVEEPAEEKEPTESLRADARIELRGIEMLPGRSPEGLKGAGEKGA